MNEKPPPRIRCACGQVGDLLALVKGATLNTYWLDNNGTAHSRTKCMRQSGEVIAEIKPPVPPPVHLSPVAAAQIDALNAIAELARELTKALRESDA